MFINKRIWQTLILCLISSANKRAEYLRKHNIFASIGNNCSIMNRKVPLYAKLIKLGNNVHLASKVDFTTHDAIHGMLNNIEMVPPPEKFPERLGCIEIGDNVFVGASTQILYNVKIGSNVIIGAHSLVNKDIPDGCVAAGVPAKIIGKFEDFVNKRKEQRKQYPDELKPHNQIIKKELEQLMWEDFYQQRQK